MLKRTAALFAIFMVLFSKTSVFAAGGTPSGIPYESMEAYIDTYAAEHIGKTSPGAAVVVVKNGEIIFSKGYGFADVENGVPVDPSQTVFEYGSVSKLFVYTSVMRLVEAGKLDLHADIRTYLPEGFLKNLRYDEPLTLMHIMNHTTGFEDYLFDVVVTSGVRQDFETTLRTGAPEQVYPPGAVSAYSNYAVALCAYIVQRTVNEDFYSYLMNTFFLPVGMENTSAHPRLEDRPELAQKRAVGYSSRGGGDFTRGEWSYIPIYPVGSVNGTAEDLARFAISLMPEGNEAGSLSLSRETINTMFTQTHAMGPGLSGFAHGFIEFDGKHRALGHGGNTAYFTAQMNIVPEERFGVVVLSNAAGETDLTQGLTKALLGAGPLQEPQPTFPLPDARDVEGTYISARRPHNGFLKLYGFMSLLKVTAPDPDTIEIRFAGGSGVYKQTAPYVYRQQSAEGSLFRYNFGVMYFDVKNGVVTRVSGDFLPLPAGHTPLWLLADAAIAGIAALFYLLTPLVLLIAFLRRKRKSRGVPSRHRTPYTLFALSGTALIANNALLVLRMLANNYRSFSEVSPHIYLNGFLAVAGVFAGLVTIWRFVKTKPGLKQRLLFSITAVIFTALIIVLWKWQFFNPLWG